MSPGLIVPGPQQYAKQVPLWAPFAGLAVDDQKYKYSALLLSEVYRMLFLGVEVGLNCCSQYRENHVIRIFVTLCSFTINTLLASIRIIQHYY